MEISGVVLRPVSGFSGNRRRQSLKHPCFSGGEKLRLQRACNSKFNCLSSAGKVKVSCSSSPLLRETSSRRESGFSDEGHLLYYVSPRSGKSEKQRGKDFPAMTTKKKLKLLKGMSKDLSVFSGMSTGDGEGLIGEVKNRMITDAAEVLLAQLQQLRAEEKELKRRKKEEKVALKATRSKDRTTKKARDGSSSSSSESSDCECNVVDVSRLRTKDAEIKPDPQVFSTVQSLPISELVFHDPVHQSQVTQSEEVKTETVSELNLNLSTHEQGGQKGLASCASSASCVEDSVTSAQKIEVCVGGKCKRSGAAELLEEFQRRVGNEGAVVGCKCMGKCRDGPNVRVLSKEREGDYAKASNPLCIGVGLEDVGVIVANFFGEKDLGLQLAA